MSLKEPNPGERFGINPFRVLREDAPSPATPGLGAVQEKMYSLRAPGAK
jgi:hypothetical protein